MENIDLSKIYKYDGAWHFDISPKEKISALSRDSLIKWLMEYYKNETKTAN